MTQEDKIEDKIAFARFINEHSHQLIGFLDTKTSIIIAINGVILGLLFNSQVPHQSLYLFYAVVILLGGSAVSGLLTIFPLSRSKKDPSMISHEGILDSPSPSEYSKKFNSTNPDKILKEETNNAYRLAKALRWQFIWVRISLGSLILAIILLAIFNISTLKS